MLSQSKSRSWNKFTIAALLAAAFCAAAAFLGFRYGLTAGIEKQLEQHLAAEKLRVYPVVYRVSPLLEKDPSGAPKTSSLAEMADEIRSATSKHRWQEDGGPSSIATMAPDMVVISTSSSDHERIAAYLKGRRDGMPAP